MRFPLEQVWSTLDHYATLGKDLHITEFTPTSGGQEISGSHVTGVCYYCHGTPTVPDTGNPAAAIPVQSNDFKLTAKSLAPIANQFLNSPHAKYGAPGTSKTVDVITKTNYGSTFVGYQCRSGATTVSGTWTATTCPAAGHTWTQPLGAAAAGCYYNATSCAAVAGSTWNTTFDPLQYPVSNGGVCSGLGLGGIITTVYRSGKADTVPNLDSMTNPACTNFGNGTATSGASGFVVREGEATSTSNSVAVVSSDQGNCMTCHDVHWSLDSLNPVAEPIRRECTTCHVDPGTQAASASGAPQIDLVTINHLKTKGTPLENMATVPSESCEICHMPKSSATGSAMHLWRVNPDAAYSTMGATQANTAASGAYTNAVWVDLDLACGQCHGGGTSSLITPSKAGVPYYTKAQLAVVAKGMHDSAGVAYPVNFTAAADLANTLKVNVAATVNCGEICPNLTYDWNWGDGSAHGSGVSTNHTFAASGTKTITLTVSLASNSKVVGSYARSITLKNTDLAPVASATCNWTANTWAMLVTDTSTDDGPDADTTADVSPVLTITVDWGDGTTKSTGSAAAVFNHTYTRTGAFTVTERATDSKLQTSTFTCATQATPAYFAIGGTVKSRLGVGLTGATVQIKLGSSIIRTLSTTTGGAFTTGAANLKPGTYALTVTKAGYTFTNPTSVIVGPSKNAVAISATAP